MSIQELIDGIQYPQNLYYDVDKLEPKGLLVHRYIAFMKYCPELFEQQKSFLDIGFATGFFLFCHAKNKTKVVGIEPDRKLFDLCDLIRHYKHVNIDILNVSFKDYKSNEKFELVFLGNCFHYLYKDEGWNIVKRLSDICQNELIIEAPLEGSYLIDIKGWHENEMSKNYTKQKFLEESSKFFKIEGIFESGTIGQRNIVVLKK